MSLLAQHCHVIKWSKDRIKSFTDIKHEAWSSLVPYNHVSAHIWPAYHEKQSWHFFQYFQNQGGFKGTDLLATMKEFTILDINYSSSQTKTQWFCHSTQHQVCFRVIPLLALPGGIGPQNGSWPFTASYNHWSAGWKAPLEVSKSSSEAWSWFAHTGQLCHCVATTWILPGCTPCITRSQIFMDLLSAVISSFRTEIILETG